MKNKSILLEVSVDSKKRNFCVKVEALIPVAKRAIPECDSVYLIVFCCLFKDAGSIPIQCNRQ
jgi:hypothetical protein